VAQTVGNYTVATFTSPVNGTSPIDANTVRGNDNTIRTAHNNHDTDAGVHVQSSTFAARPAPGIAGRKWVTADAGSYQFWYDDGSIWREIGSDRLEIEAFADENISRGDVVYVTGYNVGLNVPRIARYDGTAPAFAIATANITTGERGLILNTGVISSLDTTGYGPVGEPAVLYPVATGTFTGTKPTSGFYQQAAYLLRNNVNNGVLYVEFSGQAIVERSDNTTSTVVLRDGSGNFSAGTITASLTGNVTGDVTGNAGTATKLETAREINGVLFDGTANITVPTGFTAEDLTFDNAGTGAASPATFDGLTPVTISYNTIGAAAEDGNNATGTWPIGVDYDNTVSGLTAVNVQDAIDELATSGGTLYATLTVEGSSGTSDWTQPVDPGPWIAVMTVTGILSTDRPAISVDLSAFSVYEVILQANAFQSIYRVEASDDDEITLYSTVEPVPDFDLLIQAVR